MRVYLRILFWFFLLGKAVLYWHLFFNRIILYVQPCWCRIDAYEFVLWGASGLWGLPLGFSWRLHECWRVIKKGLWLDDLFQVSHDPRLLSNATDACCCRLGLRWFLRIVSFIIFCRGNFRHDCRLCRIGFMLSEVRMVLFPRTRVAFLLYRYCLSRFPVRNGRFVVITTKVAATTARHGIQCRSSGLSLTLVLGR